MGASRGVHRKGKSVWRVVVEAPDSEAASAASTALETVCAAVSAFESAPGGPWRVEGLAEVRPAVGLVDSALALLWRERAEPPPAVAVERLPARDWLAENQASFPPLEEGRFFIYGSHHRGAVPPGRLGLRIDAATAFGTGEHATTRGCLRALERGARRRRPRAALDMGTGTGILAMAAAKLCRCPVLAADIDAEAVRVASRNVAINGVAALVAVRHADGSRDRRLRRARRFDLIFANILARPLLRMAPGLTRALAPGGRAVLSGLLLSQERAVLAAYRLQGLALERRIVIDGWCTLVLSRGAGSSADHGGGIETS